MQSSTFFDFDTLTQISTELNKSLKLGLDSQSTKLLETLSKRNVKSKVDLQKSGLAKQIQSLAKQLDNSELQKLAKQLIKLWKEQLVD